MARAHDIYPKHMTVTDEGKALYMIWIRIRKATEKYGIFAEYPKFFNWAMDNYYVLGARLHRHDVKKPYSPNNCYFESGKSDNAWLSPDLRRMANEWNRTVNVFRKACGLKLFEVDE